VVLGINYLRPAALCDAQRDGTRT